MERLIGPVSEALTTGPDLGFSPAFDAIAELRREDDPTLAQGEWVTELKQADWPAVIRACEDLLAHQTKDLRVAGWWLDAAARVQGLPGLADGLSLTLELIRRFWDGVHPQADGGDFEERVGALAWTLKRVEELAPIAPVIPIGRLKLGLRDIDHARQHGSLPQPEGSSDVPPTWAAIQRAVAQAGLAAFDQQLAALDSARSALQALQAELDQRLGDEGPGFAGARKALENAADQLRRLGRDAGLGTASPTAGEAVAASDEPGVAAPVATVRAGPIQSRTQALAQLQEVAAYFRRTEPHSPVAYLAEKAARWGEMPLHAWLRQVVKDQGVLGSLDEMLGVDPGSGQ
ncbi:type VI secretion system protein TssA [Inhella proteolytica]|uniref:Type VI secretion system protein TssA n=1 Tax=Inhella proteolytica TaxID=2795029 RepID=A0A931J5X7_9BURK|nr:type VI secretion system protein TssA [Inhella proteolytica]MBH9578861.1 type VI secretion system protein TssA [Inhella proteolytica]